MGRWEHWNDEIKDAPAIPKVCIYIYIFWDIAILFWNFTQYNLFMVVKLLLMQFLSFLQSKQIVINNPLSKIGIKGKNSTQRETFFHNIEINYFEKRSIHFVYWWERGEEFLTVKRLKNHTYFELW